MACKQIEFSDFCREEGSGESRQGHLNALDWPDGDGREDGQTSGQDDYWQAHFIQSSCLESSAGATGVPPIGANLTDFPKDIAQVDQFVIESVLSVLGE